MTVRFCARCRRICFGQEWENCADAFATERFCAPLTFLKRIAAPPPSRTRWRKTISRRSYRFLPRPAALPNSFCKMPGRTPSPRTRPLPGTGSIQPSFAGQRRLPDPRRRICREHPVFRAAGDGRLLPAANGGGFRPGFLPPAVYPPGRRRGNFVVADEISPSGERLIIQKEFVKKKGFF